MYRGASRCDRLLWPAVELCVPPSHKCGAVNRPQRRLDDCGQLYASTSQTARTLANHLLCDMFTTEESNAALARGEPADCLLVASRPACIARHLHILQSTSDVFSLTFCASSLSGCTLHHWALIPEALQHRLLSACLDLLHKRVAGDSSLAVFGPAAEPSQAPVSSRPQIIPLPPFVQKTLIQVAARASRLLWRPLPARDNSVEQLCSVAGTLAFLNTRLLSQALLRSIVEEFFSPPSDRAVLAANSSVFVVTGVRRIVDYALERLSDCLSQLGATPAAGVPDELAVVLGLTQSEAFTTRQGLHAVPEQGEHAGSLERAGGSTAAWDTTRTPLHASRPHGESSAERPSSSPRLAPLPAALSMAARVNVDSFSADTSFRGRAGDTALQGSRAAVAGRSSSIVGFSATTPEADASESMRYSATRTPPRKNLSDAPGSLSLGDPSEALDRVLTSLWDRKWVLRGLRSNEGREALSELVSVVRLLGQCLSLEQRIGSDSVEADDSDERGVVVRCCWACSTRNGVELTMERA